MNLTKLKNASLHELRVRAAQQVSAFSERRGWSTLTKLPGDQVFVSLPARSMRTLPYSFRSNLLRELSVARKNRHHIQIALARPRHNELIAKADRIISGKFDLLGFKDLSFGDPIDWHFEPISGKRIPLVPLEQARLSRRRDRRRQKNHLGVESPSILPDARPGLLVNW